MKPEIKKVVIPAIVTLITLSSVTKKTDWEEYNLKGKVKSLTEITYKATGKAGGKATKGVRGLEPGQKDISLMFDEHGKLIVKSKLSAAGKQVYKYAYTYDDKGLKKEEIGYNSDNALFNKGIYKYENGNITEECRYDENESLFGKFIFHYDSSGNLAEEIRYDGTGAFKNKFEYVYNKAGEKTEEKNYLTDGALAFRSIFTYDDKGNLAEVSSYKGDELSGKKLFKHDDKNNLSEELEYNEKGNLLKKFNYKYEYDSAGNWIKKIKYVNDVPNYLTERKIAYHEN